MPYGVKKLGDQFTMQEGRKPQLTPKGRGKKIYDSLKDALKNGGDRYRRPDGQIRQLYFRKVPGVQDTYELRDKQQKLRPAFKQKGNRGEASRFSTGKDVDIEKSEIKGGNITRRGFQHHHLMSLRYYQPYFEALDEAGRAELTKLLNEQKIYPGDDRRNYVSVMGSNQVIGSDHQGKIHPIMDRLRAQDELQPDLARLRGMTPQQLFQEMLPRIRRDQQVVRDVLLQGRTNIMTADPELEETLKPQPFPEQQEVLPATETMVAPQDVVEPLEGFDTSAPPEVTEPLPPITQDTSGEFGQPQVMTSQQDSNLENLQEFGTQALNVVQQIPTAQIYRKAGGIYFRRVLLPTVKTAASTVSTLYSLGKAFNLSGR